MGTVEGFDPIYGAAQGQLEASPSQALLPFIFCVRAKDDYHLQIDISDFHTNTWQTELTIEDLEDKRDDVGIGGPWEEFVSYVRAAFASENVKLLLGAPASAVGGATTTKVVGQKTQGTPKVSFPLTKLEGTAASDSMSAISVNLFQVFQAQSSALSSEMARAAHLSTAFAQEKARAERLQDQVDAQTFTGKKKRRPTLTFADSSSTQTLSLQTMPSLPTILSLSGTQNTQGGSQTGDRQAQPSARQAAKSRPARIHAAPVARKPRRRGTVIGAEDNDKS